MLWITVRERGESVRECAVGGEPLLRNDTERGYLRRHQHRGFRPCAILKEHLFGFIHPEREILVLVLRNEIFGVAALSLLHRKIALNHLRELSTILILELEQLRSLRDDLMLEEQRVEKTSLVMGESCAVERLRLFPHAISSSVKLKKCIIQLILVNLKSVENFVIGVFVPYLMFSSL